eukprot:GEMP01071336.1.p1 GENE.GEMP01071336.1~~GEMP01071336.1.p1  ORF type:complete len:212 (+),score=28.51 GEMP01071336.1:82-717(+)
MVRLTSFYLDCMSSPTEGPGAHPMTPIFSGSDLARQCRLQKRMFQMRQMVDKLPLKCNYGHHREFFYEGSSGKWFKCCEEPPHKMRRNTEIDGSVSALTNDSFGSEFHCREIEPKSAHANVQQLNNANPIFCFKTDSGVDADIKKGFAHHALNRECIDIGKRNSAPVPLTEKLDYRRKATAKKTEGEIMWESQKTLVDKSVREEKVNVSFL